MVIHILNNLHLCKSFWKFTFEGGALSKQEVTTPKGSFSEEKQVKLRRGLKGASEAPKRNRLTFVLCKREPQCKQAKSN